MESHVPAYLATKNSSRKGFWHQLFSAWWLRYPWKLGDDEEPLTLQAELTRLTAVGPGEQDAKKEIEQKLTEVRRIYICSYQSRC